MIADSFPKKRFLPENNYKAFFFNGKTLRCAIDPKKPITELEHPEFYDIKITSQCTHGRCEYCYMDSTHNGLHAKNIVEKINSYFGKMDVNQRPFQVAIGGGEPTEHPEFIECLKAFYDLGIMPNYTTNGVFVQNYYRYVQNHYRYTPSEIFEATKKYCGGVAVSCHSHLRHHWNMAARKFSEAGIKLYFHLIISDPDSSDRFRKIYDQWYDIVDHFVLLPYSSSGRACKKDVDWEYLISVMPEDTTKVAFGAGFYQQLLDNPGNLNVSLYEPESMSKFLDLNDMNLYPSSFHSDSDSIN